MTLSHDRAAVLAVLLALCGAWTAPGHAAELKPQTVAAFDRYVRVTEARMAAELPEANSFLWMDGLPEARRESLYAQLRRGQVVIERLRTREEGRPIHIPSGMIHHWLGVIFIPQAALEQTLAVIQDYDNHQEIYRPSVRRSKLLGRAGDDFKVYFQLYKKTIVTVTLNSEYDVRYFRVDSARVHSQSHSTRIAEVEDLGKPGEHEKPVGKDRGYLWRLYTYWRFEEKDGGVYVQLESIALTRSIPVLLAWLVNPLVESIPRESLAQLLNATRTAVTKKSAGPAGSR